MLINQVLHQYLCPSLSQSSQLSDEMAVCVKHITLRRKDLFLSLSLYTKLPASPL